MTNTAQLRSVASAVRTGNLKPLAKTPTGISGLDKITGGGLPSGRPTLVCGSTGCGKTLLGVEFLVRGIIQFSEPGVLVTFEESPHELTQNVASLGFDLRRLVRQRKLAIDHVALKAGELEQRGEFDLEGLFIRIGLAIDTVKARRVVLDTVEYLFAGLPNPTILRAELHRLFCWLKDKGVTAIITAERGDTTLTRHGLEEYVSDCVIALDHRVHDQITTRRLRIVKYRGSTHGTNEYPFLVNHDGISLLPVTAVGLLHDASTERVSTGVPRLDTMLGGKGFFRGSSVLLSGTAGTGKTTLVLHAVRAACERGERCLYFAFEEAPSQIRRNLRSVGINLARYEKRGLLRFVAGRPTAVGLEMHLLSMVRELEAYQPALVVVDPVNSFVSSGNQTEVKTMLVRLIDYFKSQQVTAILTNLTTGGTAMEHTDAEVSSLIDTWLLLRDFESDGERNRSLLILKSRGMAHSNQVREFLITDGGIELRDVYLGPGGVLTGSARLNQETQELAERTARGQEISRLRRALESKRRALDSKVAALRAEFDAEQAETERTLQQLEAKEKRLDQARREQAKSRHADKQKK